MNVGPAAALEQVPYRVTNKELIPTERYYDPGFFEVEKQRLWPYVWQMACRLEEIPEVGDYTVYNILDKSVIMLHTKGGVKGFLNACRHRGVKLANGPGRCGADGFVCPFHGWRWNSEGENSFVFGRQIFSEEVLDRAEIDLVPVRTEYWAGCAFINFDNEAASLRDSLGPVAERMDARHADKLKMDWWFGTVLPTNWKLAMEAFMEGYHTMQTHPQLHERQPFAAAMHGPAGDGWAPNMELDARSAMVCRSAGMAGMVHETEVAVVEKLRDIEVPEDPAEAIKALYGRAYAEVTADARSRGAEMFDLVEVTQSQPYHAVEFMFPHYFLLPYFGAMSSYRIRPLTPETCFFELWSLVIRPESEPHETPTEPTVVPYDSAEFPEIPRQDYSNLPIQQLGLHNLTHMRLAKHEEGMISNYQRLIDGYLAGLDKETLRNAQNVVNSGFNSPILDIGF
jgi:carnitine monooxygenase subunit